MGKIHSGLMESVRERNARLSLPNLYFSIIQKLDYLFIKKGLLLLLFGILLGRAYILSALSPFSLPFFATVFLLRRSQALAAFIGLAMGALTISIPVMIYTISIILLFLLMYRIFTGFFTNILKPLPFFVFQSVLIGRLFWYLFEANQLNLYYTITSGIEAVLAFVLTLIFLQSLPLVNITLQRKTLKTEEIVCLVIFLASILTGTLALEIQGLSVANILSRYLILLFALAAGASLGATVGVITGLVFGLAQVENFSAMSLLAFSGLLGGLLKEWGKFGVSMGLLIGTLLLGLYGSESANLMLMAYESLFAILLLFATPKSVFLKIAKYIPGTTEYSQEQQQYLRKVRDMTAKRVEQFSSIFFALSKSFSNSDVEKEDENKEIDFFLGNITEKTCQTCYKKDYCWASNLEKTYGTMKRMLVEMNSEGRVSQQTAKEWKRFCVRNRKVMDLMQQELHLYQANEKLKKQLRESRKIVAEQLMGVSEVMDNFAKEIQKERQNHEKQEEQLMSMIQSFGIEIEHIEIYSLEPANIDIDITIPYCGGLGQCEKIIAPILTDILGEPVVVHSETCGQEFGSVCHANFRSQKTYVIETGVAHAAKDGAFLSGDCYSTIEIGTGKIALALSDGMGNGPKAYNESNETLTLLKKILQSGIDEEVAIKSINSILSLRSTDDVYATLDLSIIDLQDAKVKFLKIGSTPSFIKRGDKVLKIEASNLPIGIVRDFEMEIVHSQLKAEDLLIMMTDGIYEGPRNVENIELWLRRKILELETEEPQEVADLIMEEVIRGMGGKIPDDMTILVAKVKHNNPKWKSIPVKGLKKWA